ncbi:hypothetical protein SmJEL517_g03458 [Synchytrium microbalum]|uniref:Transcription factor Pcc1 n=1 Tax=Synchytrium microbalum TaxID=1806994 RepID=A0A507C6S1_9FUNG|nr:uncharacterized protein SmJEL517_g03458 [Synchytrium microbalum]TPX33754.1 hypothetical protein SmJEL517_g03458 [Synchytrium microbalum]
MTSNASLPYKAELHIPFPTSRQAHIARTVLQVDKDPRPSESNKELAVLDGNVLHVIYRANSLKLARAAVNGFMDHVILVIQTLESFDDEAAI